MQALTLLQKFFSVDMVIYAAIVLVAATALVRCTMPLSRVAARLRRAARTIVTESKQNKEKKSWNDMHFLGDSLSATWADFLQNAEMRDAHGETCDVTQYINEDTVIYALGRTGFAGLAPGVMTSLGILGTFLGLVMGLSGLSLTAHPGDIIGITGPVACGKSTLGRVFLCEAPYQGSVCFGGRELSALTPRQIAATVGYLGHDPELSADTVQNNVLCGSEQDVMPWLAAAALKEEVLAMEKGTETVIGSGGTRLSGGQAQRLALARTLAHPRPVLVLDDPFSALDRSTEDAIFAELQAYARDKVVFLISHRLYHFPQMQQIIFMEGGRTTVGTHEELMTAVPVYRQLYESQTGLKGGEGA